MPEPGDLFDGLFKLKRELGQGAASRVFQAALESQLHYIKERWE
jgi:hypothetical protein